MGKRALFFFSSNQVKVNVAGNTFDGSESGIRKYLVVHSTLNGGSGRVQFMTDKVRYQEDTPLVVGGLSPGQVCV